MTGLEIMASAIVGCIGFAVAWFLTAGASYCPFWRCVILSARRRVAGDLSELPADVRGFVGRL